MTTPEKRLSDAIDEDVANMVRRNLRGKCRKTRASIASAGKKLPHRAILPQTTAEALAHLSARGLVLTRLHIAVRRALWEMAHG